jgi:hypothetical protein
MTIPTTVLIFSRLMVFISLDDTEIAASQT